MEEVILTILTLPLWTAEDFTLFLRGSKIQAPVDAIHLALSPPNERKSLVQNGTIIGSLPGARLDSRPSLKLK